MPHSQENKAELLSALIGTRPKQAILTSPPTNECKGKQRMPPSVSADGVRAGCRVEGVGFKGRV